MKRYSIAAIAVLIILSGCKPEFWAKTPPPEPGPKTKEEFLTLFRPIIEPLRQTLSTETKTNPTGLSDEARDQVLKALGEAKTKYAEIPAAQEAFKEIGLEVSVLAKTARDQERWRLALVCVDAFEILGMKSLAMERLDRHGHLIMAQPKVAVRGFIEDKETGVTTAFVELVDRTSGKITRVAKRPGDEFEGLRLVDIVKQHNSVRFEYLPIEGMFFDVEGPRR